MKGWKTWVGGIGVILSGLATAMAGLVADPIDFQMVMGGITAAGAGLAAIGIGHKLEKASAP